MALGEVRSNGNGIAGGVLSGNYPNPTFAEDVVIDSDYNSDDDLDGFANGTIQSVTGDAPNAPSAGATRKFMVITHQSTAHGSRSQMVTQFAGVGIGNIYNRTYSSGIGWTAWTLINNP